MLKLSHNKIADIDKLKTCLIDEWAQFDQSIVPRSRTVFGSGAFSIAARPQAWNQLPADIRNTATYSTFKHHLKSFLFSVAYEL